MVDNFVQGPATQHQDLQSKPGVQVNVSDQSGAFDIDRSGFKLNQFVKMPGFPQTPLSASGHDRNEDSQFDLMDIEPDYKITPSSWKQNQLTENRFDTLGHEGLPEHTTYRNPVSNSSHISSSVAFVGSAQNLEAPVEGDDLVRVEIERKAKQISDKDERIKRCTQELQLQDMKNMHLIKHLRGDLEKLRKAKSTLERQNKGISEKGEKVKQSAQHQDKKNMHPIGQLRGDLDNFREEKLTLEKANHSLVRENREAKELQGKAKKNTDLIEKLSGELGSLRKKPSRLEKANKSLTKETSEFKANSDTFCQLNPNLKEENRDLRASIDNLRPLKLEIDETKETIGAQKTEIQDHTQRIAALKTCIDKISSELLWRTEELQEVEGFLLREESISKYYRDRYCLLWNKNQALEAAGDSRETEFAKLEL